MTSIILACIWVLVAQLIAFLPSRDKHWRAAYGLMIVGLPLLVFVYVENGILLAIVMLFAGASILRWPVYYGFLKVRKIFGVSQGDHNE